MAVKLSDKTKAVARDIADRGYYEQMKDANFIRVRARELARSRVPRRLWDPWIVEAIETLGIPETDALPKLIAAMDERVRELNLAIRRHGRR